MTRAFASNFEAYVLWMDLKPRSFTEFPIFFPILAPRVEVPADSPANRTILPEESVPCRHPT
jgi:hypothetical protein